MIWEGQTPALSRGAARFWTIAFLAVAAVASLGADTVTLTNGNIITGVIVQQTSSQIVVDTQGGRMTIPRARIRSIEAGHPWEAHLQRAREQMAASRWQSAREALQAALAMMDERGIADDDPSRQQVNEGLARCDEQIETQSAAVFAQVLAQVEELLEAQRFQEAADLLAATASNAEAGLPVQVLNRRQAEIYLALARHQSDMTETANATASLRRALELDPELAEAHWLLGQFLAERNPDSQEAIGELRQALDLFPETTDPEVVNAARYRLAQCLEAAGQHIEASEQFARVHEVASRDFPRALSKAVDNIMSWAEAQPLGNALSAGPASGEAGGTPASNEITAAAASGEEVDELIRQLLRARELDPSRVEPLNLLGDVYNILGRQQEAIAQYRASLQIQQAQPTVHLRLGEIYIRLPGTQSQDLAEQALRFAVRYDANLYGAHCALAEICERRGQLEAALAEIQSAIAINSNFSRAYVIRGRVHRAQEDNDAAKADFLAAIERSGNTLEPRLEMGRILAEENKLDEARTYFDQVLQLVESGEIPVGINPDNVRAQCRVGIGRLLLRRNQTNQARDEITQATHLDPTYGDAFTALGDVFVAMEDYSAAEQAYQRAIQLDPDEPNNYFLLGNLYKEYIPGHNDDAIANFHLYLDHNGTDVDAVRQLLAVLETSN